MSKLSLNCGSCLFLNRERCFERRCADLGKIPTNKACGTHKPDMFNLVGTHQKIDRLHKMAEAIHGMSANELQTLSAVLHAEKNTRKAGWRFMQKVYVRYIGSSSRNYLSNFLVGYVLYADKEYVRIVGDSGKVFLSVMNEKNGDTVYTVSQFNELRSAMIAANKRVDPESSYVGARGFVSKLDKVVEQDRPLRKQVVKGRSSEDDLVSIVSRMARGVLGRSSQARRQSSKEGAEISLKW